MMLKPTARALSILPGLLALALAAPASAQEETPPGDAEGGKRLFLEVNGWIAQAAGLDYTPATQLDPFNPLATSTLEVDHGTQKKLRYRAGWRLPGSWGQIVGSYYSHDEEAALNRNAPGQYIFIETATHPYFAGFNNDRRADAFSTATSTDLRDARLDWYHPAFRTERARGQWSIGWRRVSHVRRMFATYRALVPDLPALIPPLVDCTNCPDLSPDPDRAMIASSFEGRGLNAGFQVDLALWKDQIVMETGVDVAVLRGKTDADYTSLNSAYVCRSTTPNICTRGDVFNPRPGEGYGFFADKVDPSDPTSDVVGQIVNQANVELGIVGDRSSTTASVLEAFVGFRWHARPWLDVQAGFRTARYDDVGVDLRPKQTTLSVDSFGFVVVGIDDLERVNHSATYEWFYGGVSFRLY